MPSAHEELLRLRGELLMVIRACNNSGCPGLIPREIAIAALRKSEREYGDFGLIDALEERHLL